MARIDFMSDPITHDLIIENGDFKLGDNTSFQVDVILNASPGQIRRHPQLGVNLESYLGSDEDIDVLDNIIEEQLAIDNFVVVNIDTEISNGTITSNIQVK